MSGPIPVLPPRAVESMRELSGRGVGRVRRAGLDLGFGSSAYIYPWNIKTVAGAALRERLGVEVSRSSAMMSTGVALGLGAAPLHFVPTPRICRALKHARLAFYMPGRKVRAWICERHGGR